MSTPTGDGLPLCGTKRRYPTLDRARRQREANQAKSGRLLRVYQCDDCDGWHLTKQGVTAWPPKLVRHP